MDPAAIMVHNCNVPVCPLDIYIRKNAYVLPAATRDPIRRALWLGAMRLSEDDVAKYSRVGVCEIHFKPSDFKRDLRAEMGLREPVRMLKEDAVPSRFISLHCQVEDYEGCVYDTDYIDPAADGRNYFIEKDAALVEVSGGLYDDDNAHNDGGAKAGGRKRPRKQKMDAEAIIKEAEATLSADQIPLVKGRLNPQHYMGRGKEERKSGIIRPTPGRSSIMQPLPVGPPVVDPATGVTVTPVRIFDPVLPPPPPKSFAEKKERGVKRPFVTLTEFRMLKETIRQNEKVIKAKDEEINAKVEEINAKDRVILALTEEVMELRRDNMEMSRKLAGGEGWDEGGGGEDNDDDGESVLSFDVDEEGAASAMCEAVMEVGGEGAEEEEETTSVSTPAPAAMAAEATKDVCEETATLDAAITIDAADVMSAAAAAAATTTEDDDDAQSIDANYLMTEEPPSPSVASIEEGSDETAAAAIAETEVIPEDAPPIDDSS